MDFRLSAGDQQVLLMGWVDRIQASISHADGKASILLGLSGTALTLLPARVLPPLTHTGLTDLGALALLQLVVATVGLGFLAGCVLALILTVRPDLRGPAREPVYGSPIGAGHLSAGQITALAADAGRQDTAGVALHVARLSQIATRKHERVRAAITFLLLALPFLAAAAVLGGLS